MNIFISYLIVFMALLPHVVRELLFYSYYMFVAWLVAIALTGEMR